MAAYINGPALSSLLFSFVTESGDQEGFLLGSLVNHVQDNISDSQISNYKVETKLYMQSYCPWPSSPRLYSNTGTIDPRALSELLKERQKEVIGWYRFRRNSSLRVSMRESSLHQSLLRQLELSVADHAHFLFLLSSSSASSNLAMLNLDHTFLVYSEGKFTKLPARVVNLGETVNSDYRLQPSAGVSPSSLNIQSVLSKFQKNFEDQDGEMLEVKRVHALSDSLHNQLKGLARSLVEGDRKREQLEEEVRGLAARVRHLEERKFPPTPLPPLPVTRMPGPGGKGRLGAKKAVDLLMEKSPGLDTGHLLPQHSSNGGASQPCPAPRGADPAPEDVSIPETPSPMEVDSVPQTQRASSPELAEASSTGDHFGECTATEEGTSSSKDHFAFVSSLLSKEKQQPVAGGRGETTRETQRQSTRSTRRAGVGSGRGAAGTVRDAPRRSSCSPELLPGRGSPASSDSSTNPSSPGQGRGTGSRSRGDDLNRVRSRSTRARSSSRSLERQSAKNMSSKVTDAKGKKPNTDSLSKSGKMKKEEEAVDEKSDLLQLPSNSPVF